MESLISPLTWQIALGIILAAVILWLGRLIIVVIVSCFVWISDQELWGVVGLILLIGLGAFYALIQEDSPKTLKDVAEKHFQRQEYNESLEAYKKAVQLKPEDVSARKRIAEIYSNLGKYDEAI